MAQAAEIFGPDERAYPKVIRTLLLDDSTFDRARIRRMSAKTQLMIDLTEVGNIAELKRAAEAQAYDLILIDYRLPQGDGLEVLAHLQASFLNSGAATIMITGNGDMETAVTAMRQGCNDFLTKEAMTTEQLRVAMVSAVQAATAQRDLAAQSAHQREVIRDGLTAAFMDSEVRSSVVALFRGEFQAAVAAHGTRFAAQDHSDLEALLATLNEGDEFVFS
jgi:PleD family two-component response regulator